MKRQRKLFDFCSSSSSKHNPVVCGSSSDYPSGSSSIPSTELSEESESDPDESPESVQNINVIVCMYIIILIYNILI